MDLEGAELVVACWLLTAFAALLPLPAALLRRKDLPFLAFYAQPVLYLFLVPSLNVTFPHSAFAFPAVAHRYISFTRDQVETYATLEAQCLVLFMGPLVGVYKALSRPRGPLRQERPVRAVDPTRLFIFCAFASALATGYIVVGVRNGLLSPYSATPEGLLDLPRVDFFFLRLFPLVFAPLLWIFALAVTDSTLRRVHRLLAFGLFAPALAGALVRVSGSRLGLIVVLVVLLSLLELKAKQSLRSVALATLAGVTVIAGLRYIPVMRRVVADAGDFSETSSDEITHRVTNSDAVEVDYGARLDGLEVMALASPTIDRSGPLYFPNLAARILVPISPLFPELERAIKTDSTLLQKPSYMAPLTPITDLDYTTVSVTEAYANLGVMAFPLCALVFALVLAAVSRAVRRADSFAAVAIALFALWHLMPFEFDFTEIVFGWTKEAPIAVAVALIGVWRRVEPASVSASELAVSVAPASPQPRPRC